MEDEDAETSVEDPTPTLESMDTNSNIPSVERDRLESDSATPTKRHPVTPSRLEPSDVVISQQIQTEIVGALAAARKAGLPDAVCGLVKDQQAFMPKHFHAPPEDLENLSVRLYDEYRRVIKCSPRKDRILERTKLPINGRDAWKRIVGMVRDADVSIIIGTTGSGKTTQVPQLILDHAIMDKKGACCNIICTQPRRIATTSVARRVAYERNEPLQNSVGYEIRHDTRLPKRGGSINCCVTGSLLRRLQIQPDEVMESHSHLLFDEIHDRSLENDLLLTGVRQVIMARRLKGQGNPRSVLMSATVEADLFAIYFGQSRRDELPLQVASLDLPGRTFPVTAKYLGDVMPSLIQTYDKAQLGTLLGDGKYDKDTRLFLEIENALARNVKPQSRLEAEGVEALCPINLVAAVVAHVVQTSPSGTIHVFLPGLMEIDRTAEALNTEGLWRSIFPTNLNTGSTRSIPSFVRPTIVSLSNWPMYDRLFLPQISLKRQSLCRTSDTSLTVAKFAMIGLIQ